MGLRTKFCSRVHLCTYETCRKGSFWREINFVVVLPRLYEIKQTVLDGILGPLSLSLLLLRGYEERREVPTPPGRTAHRRAHGSTVFVPPAPLVGGRSLNCARTA